MLKYDLSHESSDYSVSVKDTYLLLRKKVYGEEINEKLVAC